MFQLGHFDVERNLEATFLVPHYNVQVPVRTIGEACAVRDRCLHHNMLGSLCGCDQLHSNEGR